MVGRANERGGGGKIEWGGFDKKRRGASLTMVTGHSRSGEGKGGKGQFGCCRRRECASKERISDFSHLEMILSPPYPGHVGGVHKGIGRFFVSSPVVRCAVGSWPRVR